MKSLSNFRHLISLAATTVVFTAILGVLTLRSSPDAAAPDWPMYGGGLSRDLVNLAAKGIPITCDVSKGDNVLWSVDLGSKAYGGPVVAGGRIFVGTNNDSPRDPTIKGDKGVLMCFDQATGKFLWQAVHDKLAAGRVNDWPREGICSSPIVEGDRLYYVNNRAEVICADTAGADGKLKSHWKLDMIGELGVFPHNL